MLAATLAVAVAGGSVVRGSAGAVAPPVSALASAPVALQAAASAALGAHALRYSATHRNGALVSSGGGFSTTFTGSGLALRFGEAKLGMSFAGIGYGTQLAAPVGAVPTAKSNEVSYSRSGVTEWYRNGPLGLEQGFTLTQKPVGNADSGLLTLAIRTSGPLQLSQHGSRVTFTSPSGAVGSYSGLTAFDASGRSLPSKLVAHNGTLLLRVNDSGAHYPLTIDPFINSSTYGKLDGTGLVGAAQSGASVAISADGNTALVGAPQDNSGVGSALVFFNTGGNWAQQGAKLTGAGETGAGNFGNAVALSDDGNTALVGGSADSTNAGAAWVYTRSGSVWSAQGAKLTGASQDNTHGAVFFGSAVALSSDGSTAIIGASRDWVSPTNPGSAYAFLRTSGTWTQQAKLNGTGGTAAFLQFGLSVAVSDDGNTTVIGGKADGNGPGAIWIFTRSGTTWTQQGSKLTATGAIGDAHLGNSVAISADGNTVLAGGFADNSNQGAAWAYTRSGTTWTQQAKLVASDEYDLSQFGQAVALSADGNTAVIGGPLEAGGIGVTWMFTRSGTTWTQKGWQLLPGDRVGSSGPAFGSSIALSSNGLRSLTGGPADNASLGAGYVYNVTAPGVPTSVTAEAYDAAAWLTFTTNDSAFTSYTATASPGGLTATGTSDGIYIEGLTNGTPYTFTVRATNAVSTSVASLASNTVTPVATTDDAAPTQPQSSPAPAADPTPPVAAGSPASSGTVTSDNGTTITWPAGTFSVPVTVSTTSATGLTRTTLAVGSFAVQLNVTNASGVAVTQFSSPIQLVFPSVPVGGVPAYSHDGGLTWTAIPEITGTTLPAGYTDGWYRDAAGNVHMLTLHATAFGVLAAGSVVTSALQVKVGVRSTLNVNYHRTLAVYLRSSLPGTGTITLRVKGRAIATVKRTLKVGTQLVTLALPKAARHAGSATLTVGATANTAHATSVTKISFVAHWNKK